MLPRSLYACHTQKNPLHMLTGGLITCYATVASSKAAVLQGRTSTSTAAAAADAVWPGTSEDGHLSLNTPLPLLAGRFAVEAEIGSGAFSQILL